MGHTGFQGHESVTEDVQLALLPANIVSLVGTIAIAGEAFSMTES